MVKVQNGNKWLTVPAAILLGSLYGMLHPLPPSTEPPRVQAATGAAACFGLLFLFLIIWISETVQPTAMWGLGVALLGVLGFSVYRIEHHVQQAACPSDKEINYLMAGGGKFQEFEVMSAVCLFLLCLLGCVVSDIFSMFLSMWLGAVGIGLACAAGGRYWCSESQ